MQMQWDFLIMSVDSIESHLEKCDFLFNVICHRDSNLEPDFVPPLLKAISDSLTKGENHLFRAPSSDMIDDSTQMEHNSSFKPNKSSGLQPLSSSKKPLNLKNTASASDLSKTDDDIEEGEEGELVGVDEDEYEECAEDENENLEDDNIVKGQEINPVNIFRMKLVTCLLPLIFEFRKHFSNKEDKPWVEELVIRALQFIISMTSCVQRNDIKLIGDDSLSASVCLQKQDINKMCVQSLDIAAKLLKWPLVHSAKKFTFDGKSPDELFEVLLQCESEFPQLRTDPKATSKALSTSNYRKRTSPAKSSKCTTSFLTASCQAAAIFWFAFLKASLVFIKRYRNSLNSSTCKQQLDIFILKLPALFNCTTSREPTTIELKSSIASPLQLLWNIWETWIVDNSMPHNGKPDNATSLYRFIRRLAPCDFSTPCFSEGSPFWASSLLVRLVNIDFVIAGYNNTPEGLRWALSLLEKTIHNSVFGQFSAVPYCQSNSLFLDAILNSPEMLTRIRSLVTKKPAVLTTRKVAQKRVNFVNQLIVSVRLCQNDDITSNPGASVDIFSDELLSIPFSAENLLLIGLRFIGHWICNLVIASAKEQDLQGDAADRCQPAKAIMFACLFCQLETAESSSLGQLLTNTWPFPFTQVLELASRHWPTVRTHFVNYLLQPTLSTQEPHYVPVYLTDVDLINQIVTLEMAESSKYEEQPLVQLCIKLLKKPVQPSVHQALYELISQHSDELISIISF